MKILTRSTAALGALALSLWLLGCGGPARLHILIPDFVPAGVDGVQIYRVLDGGVLKKVGRVVFGGLKKTATGLQVEYSQLLPSGYLWGPLSATLVRPKPGQAQLQLTIVNPSVAGYYRFASYNEHGTSKPTAGELYLAAQP